MCKIVNKGVFKRNFGSVAINDQVKYVRVKDLKRLWIEENKSKPYETINEYEQDKLIKDDNND